MCSCDVSFTQKQLLPCDHAEEDSKKTSFFSTPLSVFCGLHEKKKILSTTTEEQEQQEQEQEKGKEKETSSSS
jgi:hypothetical protein